MICVLFLNQNMSFSFFFHDCVSFSGLWLQGILNFFLRFFFFGIMAVVVMNSSFHHTVYVEAVSEFASMLQLPKKYSQTPFSDLLPFLFSYLFYYVKDSSVWRNTSFETILT